MDAEEDLILARIKKRDKEAFRYLYEYYFAKMVLFAESYLYDEEEARDLVQDLFFHLWNHAGTLQVATSVKAYLFTSVRNRCLNAIRDRKIRDEHNNKLFEAQLFSWELVGNKALLPGAAGVQKAAAQYAPGIVPDIDGGGFLAGKQTGQTAFVFAAIVSEGMPDVLDDAFV